MTCVPFPSPPWHLRGTLWLSLFAVRSGTSDRPPGLYGAAFVDYTDPGVLSYHELLVARLVRDQSMPRVHISDIWVDSETSRDGGRSLWAIPKDLADLHLAERGLGPAARTAWSSSTSGTPIAAAAFTSLPGAALRTPVTFTVLQHREDSTPVVTGVHGSARTLPCTGGWRFGTDGPLAWLRGRRALASFRMSDFRLTFGG